MRFKKRQTSELPSMPKHAKLDFVWEFAEDFDPILTKDYPDFDVYLTDEEDKSLDPYMKMDVDKEEFVFVHGKKMREALSPILHRIQRDYYRWQGNEYSDINEDEKYVEESLELDGYVYYEIRPSSIRQRNIFKEYKEKLIA